MRTASIRTRRADDSTRSCSTSTTPRNLLGSAHAAFYNRDGLGAMAGHIADDGVFALWSDDPPDEDFTAELEEVFEDVEAQRIWFDNPMTGGKASNTVYVGIKR
ncbi:hypothetical protein GCM10029992_03270 [Glycomyces albus]